MSPSARLGKKRSGAPRSWPRQASLVLSGQITFSRALRKKRKRQGRPDEGIGPYKNKGKAPYAKILIKRGISMIRYDAGKYDIAVIGAGH